MHSHNVVKYLKPFSEDEFIKEFLDTGEFLAREKKNFFSISPLVSAFYQELLGKNAWS